MRTHARHLDSPCTAAASKRPCPSSATNDLIWIKVVLEAAKSAKGLPLRPESVDEAKEFCTKHRLIARSNRRHRRPTNEELQRLDEHFTIRDRHKSTVVPMRSITWFAITSTRREAEICRLEWTDNDEESKSGLVRDAKHPREKIGNHRRFKYTPEGLGNRPSSVAAGSLCVPCDRNV